MLQRKPGTRQSYSHRWIASVVTGQPEPIRLDQIDEERDVVLALYNALPGGPAAIEAAWNAIKKLRPDLNDLQKKRLYLADELKLLPKVSTLVREYPFYASELNLLAAPAGVGKSFVAMDFCARTVAAGGVVVYIAGEGLYGYAARWEVLKVHQQIDDEAATRYTFYAEPVQLIDQESRTRFINDLANAGVHPNLVVIDTFARSAVGVDENSNSSVGLFVEACRLLKEELGAGVLLVHHTGKSGTIRGATALHGAVDCAVTISRADGVLRLSNKLEDGGKNKNGPEWEYQYMELIPRTVGEYSSAVLVPAKAVNHSPAASGRFNATQSALLELLDTYDAPVTAKTLIEASDIAQATVYRNLAMLKKDGFVAFDSEGEKYSITPAGKKAFYSADEDGDER